MKNRPSGQVVCKVVSLTHVFPSAKSQYLITEFGDCSSDVTQTTQVVTHVELETLDLRAQRRFTAQWFPSESLQYMIPLELYNHKLAEFQKLQSQDKLIGKRFKVQRNNRGPQNEKLPAGQQQVEYKIEEVRPLEPEVCPNSYFESIIAVEVDSQFMMRGDRSRR